MTNQAHTARAHAALAPSAAHRWIPCPGSIVLEQGFPNTQSSYAAEGTAAHELASWCLSNDEEPEDHLGLWIDTRASNGNPFIDLSLDDDIEREENRYFEITDDMVVAVTVYTDLVREVLKKAKDCELAVEQRLDMTHLHPDIFGTGDATIYSESLQELHVFDYKHGKGHAVGVEENPQLLLYGVGTARRFSNRPIEKIVLYIVQPRAGGRTVKSAEYDIIDLFEFEDMVQAAAARVDDAQAHMSAANTNPQAWQRAYLVADEHCKFCRALATCPAARAKALEMAQAEFDPIEEVMVLPDFLTFTPEQMAETLANADQISSWIKAVQAHAHAEACSGRFPAGYKLVAKRANRKWRDEAEALALLSKAGLKKDQLYEDPKAKGPAKIEKIMKPKIFAAWVSDHTDEEGNGPIVKQSSGTNLVPVGDPRPAVKLDGASEFGQAE